MEIFNKKFKLKAKQFFNDISLDSVDWAQSFVRIVVSMFWAYLAIGFCKAFFMWINHLAGSKADFTTICWAIGVAIFVIRFPISKINRVCLTYDEYKDLRRRNDR